MARQSKRPPSVRTPKARNRDGRASMGGSAGLTDCGPARAIVFARTVAPDTAKEEEEK